MLRIRNKGVTLIEVIVVVVILGILVGIGLPALQSWLTNRRLSGAAENLVQALHYTQSESVRISEVTKMTLVGGAQWSYLTDTAPSRTGDYTSFAGVTLTISGVIDTDSDGIEDIEFEPKRGTLINLNSSPNSKDILMTLTIGSQSVTVRGTRFGQFSICTSTNAGGYGPC